jgi:CDP-diacylglycerol--glycerol-3-phosphate 3-phosphatidyltransferase
MTGASTMAFILFVIGAITDWADGYVARKQGLVSNFGKLMDALTDKVFMVGLFITMVVLGELPGLWSLFLLLLILSREFLITGLRLVAASSGIILAAEKSGKHKTVSQIVSCCCWRLRFVRTSQLFFRRSSAIPSTQFCTGLVCCSLYWQPF